MSNTKTVRPYLDIKAQIEGRCSEILLLLGINPLAMATQITCPVAEHHAGRVSFRVNPVTNRYFCAHCQPKGASLVDLVIQLGKAGSFAAAADYLRAGLDIKPQKTLLQALGDMPDPLAQIISKKHGDHPVQTDDGDPVNDIPLFEQQITAMLDAANPANLHPYSLHRRFAPIGARATDGGNLLIPAHDHAGNLCGLLQISLQGKHLVVSDGRLMGAASTLGQFKDARVIAATLDWESQVVLHTVYGGMPIIGYLTPDNALLAVDEFLTSATKEIWVFAGPSDVPELQAGMTLYANDNDLKLKWFSTKEPDYSIAYGEAKSTHQLFKLTDLSRVRSMKLEHDHLSACIKQISPSASMRRLVRAEKHQVDAVVKLTEKYKNFSSFLLDYLAPQINLQAAMGEALCLPNFCLVGPPGIGKTAMLSELAEVLGIGSDVFDASSLQASHVLNGLSRNFATADFGLIFKTMMLEKSHQTGELRPANALICVDEVEKVGKSDHYGSILDLMLTLLEQRTAARFVDAALPELPLNLSALNWCFTSNSLDALSAPLRSRLIAIDIPPPTHDQSIEIAASIFAERIERIAGRIGYLPSGEPLMKVVFGLLPLSLGLLLQCSFAHAQDRKIEQAIKHRKAAFTLMATYVNRMVQTVDGSIQA